MLIFLFLSVILLISWSKLKSWYFEISTRVSQKMGEKLMLKVGLERVLLIGPGVRIFALQYSTRKGRVLGQLWYLPVSKTTLIYLKLRSSFDKKPWWSLVKCPPWDNSQWCLYNTQSKPDLLWECNFKYQHGWLNRLMRVIITDNIQYCILINLFMLMFWEDIRCNLTVEELLYDLGGGVWFDWYNQRNWRWECFLI